MTAEQQAAWDADPSPSFDALAAEIGIDLWLSSPAEPSMDVDWQTQVFWPAPPPAASERYPAPVGAT